MRITAASPPLGCLVGTNCSKSRPIWDQKYRSPLCIAEADVPDLDHLSYNVLNRASMLVKEHVLHWSQRLGQESAFNSMNMLGQNAAMLPLLTEREFNHSDLGWERL